MVIEHSAGAPERICASPSLWMGGKRVAELLREAGLVEGHRVGYSGHSKIGWVQTFVGCLRVGACFTPAVDASSAAAEGVSAFFDEQLDLLPQERAASGDEGRIRFSDGSSLSNEDLGAIWEELPAVMDPTHERLGTTGNWGADWRLFAIELLGGLRHGLEIHIYGPDVSAADVAAKGCLPHLLVGPHWNTQERGFHAQLKQHIELRRSDVSRRKLQHHCASGLFGE
jgi:hypothetical protein